MRRPRTAALVVLVALLAGGLTVGAGPARPAAAAPPGPEPIPEGLWDAPSPFGASDPVGPEGDYLVVEGAAGDPVVGDRSFVWTRQDGANPGVVSYYFDDSLGFIAQNGRSGAEAEGLVLQAWGPGGARLTEPGYYPYLQRGRPDSGHVGVDLTWFTAPDGGTRCEGTITGWVAIDHIRLVGPEVYDPEGDPTQGLQPGELDMRIEQSCDGGPPIHVEYHTDLIEDPLPLPPGPPFGFVDEVAPGPGRVEVSGWAIDPDVTSPIQVHVYVDGTGVAVVADGDRPDVGRAFPGYGSAHGYRAVVPAKAGSHRMCAYAIDAAGGANTVLGCRTVVVPGGAPFGFVDDVAAAPGRVEVSGWAIDPDVTSPIQVHVYVDGTGVAVVADGDRPDVGRAFPGYGSAHGYRAVVPAKAGSHRMCAYAIDAAGGANTVLGCRTVVVPGGAPFGFLDEAVGVTGGVRVSGWAIDPDTASPIQVHVYVDGAGVALRADAPRPDVGAAFPAYGSGHGYGSTIAAPTGTHRVCAYAIDSGGGGNPLLACRSVTVR